MKRSRISYHLKKQSSRNIFLALTGIIVILVLIMVFGMDFLINFSLFVRKSTSGKDLQKNNLLYVAPPILNPMPEATKSATVIISGYAQDKQTVKLYVNGKLVDKKEVKDDRQFIFDNVELEKGLNEIKTKAQTENDKESDYSSIITINYIDNPPSLEINSPQDGQSVPKESLKISGKTDPGVKITINDFWAITEDDGSFSYTITVHDGENKIKITATDAAGNSTTKEITVKTN